MVGDMTIDHVMEALDFDPGNDTGQGVLPGKRKKNKQQKKELNRQTVLGNRQKDIVVGKKTKSVSKLIRLNPDNPVHRRVMVQLEDWKEQGKNVSSEIIDAIDIGMNVNNPVRGAKYLQDYHPNLIEVLVTKSNAELQKRIDEQDNTIAMMHATIAMLFDEIEDLKCNQVGMIPVVKRVDGLLKAYDRRTNAGIVIASKQNKMVGSG